MKSNVKTTELTERFSSRLGMIVSVLGIAVGTGNIWRFPRIAAQNAGEEGAGSFLIVWLLFLMIWSVPLIIAEYGIGRGSRKGLTGAFIRFSSEKTGWMGSFIGLVAIAIMFYYSVVTGWCFYYFGYFIVNTLPADTQTAKAVWDGFQSSHWPVFGHFLAVVFSAVVVAKGVKIIEKVNKCLIPVLVMILIGSAIRAFTLEGSIEGLRFLFTPDWATLGNPKIWLEALTQNAWDTGAGWGLIATYAIYMRKQDKISTVAFQTGLGNNTISLLAAMIIFASVFAVLGQFNSKSEILAIMQDSGPASTGLTFIWMPQLFSYMIGGKWYALLFFAGLSFAAFSSLLSMLEMAVRLGVDVGINRQRGVILVAIITFIAGIPSAINLNFFGNQDFVWGVALMLSGGFIAWLIRQQEAEQFRIKYINTTDSADTLGRWWNGLITWIIPIEAVVLLVWWLYRSAVEFSPNSWYNPFDPYSPASCLVQWGILMGILLYTNKRISQKVQEKW